MVVRLRDTLIPGSARVPRAGERVLAIANFIYAAKFLEAIASKRKVRFGETPKPTCETRALPGVRLLRRFLSLAHASLQNGSRVFPIKFGNETGADFRWAHCFAFIGIRSIAEAFCVHLPHHSCHP